MSAIPVEISILNSYPHREIRIGLSGETILGDLRGEVSACIGGNLPVENMWVYFTDERTAYIPFGRPNQGTDGLQIQFLRCSNTAGSPVSVGVFINKAQHEMLPEPDAPQPEPRNKRAADGEQFARSTVPRVD